MDDIREFIITKAIEVNEKMDKKLEIVCCKNTLMQVKKKHFLVIWKSWK